MNGYTVGRGDECEELRCTAHPERQADAVCVSCGTSLCRECKRVWNMYHLCPGCFSQTAVARFPPGVVVPSGYTGPPFAGAPSGTAFPPPLFTAHRGGSLPLGELGAVSPREVRWRQKDWNITEVMLSLLLIFVVYNVVGTAVTLAFKRSLLASSLSYILVFCPLVFVCTAWVLRRHGKGLGILVDSPHSWKRILLLGMSGATVSLVLGYGVLFLILLAIYALAGRIPEQLKGQDFAASGPAALVLTIFVVVVLAPVFEETFFRGLLYPTLRNRLGVGYAVLLNGLIFGVLHFQPLYMLSLALVGAVLALLYEKTESIVTPMLAHGLYNALVVLIAVLLKWDLF